MLGVSNAEKWGDHQKKKFFINNSVEAVILFKVLGVTSGPIETACTVEGWGGVPVSPNIPANDLKQILIHKL